MSLGIFDIDAVINFPANTHNPTTGAAQDADAAPAWFVYEDDGNIAIQAGSMSLRDSASTEGFYKQSLTLSAANGFEAGKYYTVYIEATVAGVKGTMSHTFQVGPAPANVTEWDGNAGAVKLEGTSGLPDMAVGWVGDVTIRPESFENGAITAASIAAAALNGKGDWNIGKTGYDLNADQTAVSIGTVDVCALNSDMRGTDGAATPGAPMDLITDALDSDSLATSAVNEIRDAILPEQNQPIANLPFIFVSSTDGRTPVTGATGITVQRSIDGGAYQPAEGTVSEIGSGTYSFDATANDMNGGKITFIFRATGGTPDQPEDRYLTVVTGGGV